MRNSKAIGLSTVLVLSVLVSAIPMSVSAQPAGWSAPESVSPGDGNGESASSVSVAIGIDGNGLAAWDDYLPDFGARAVFYRWYEVGQGWGPTQIIFDYFGANVDAAQVAVSRTGDFMLVAIDHGGFGGPFITTYRYDAATHVLDPIASPTGLTASSIEAPQVAMDLDGNAVVAWMEYDGTFWNVTANHYSVGSGWDGQVALDDQDSDPDALQLVMEPSGGALATWVQSDGTHFNLYSASSVDGIAWASPLAVDNLDTRVYQPVLEIDQGGNVQAAWVQSNGTYGNVYACVWNPLSGWVGVNVLTGPGNEGAGIVRLAGGSPGTFVATWNQYNGIEYQQMASIYDNGDWEAATNLSAQWAEGGGELGYAGFDAYGHAVVVWDQYGGGHHLQVYAAWGQAGFPWGMAQRVDSSAAVDASLRGFTLNGVGWGLVFWSQGSGYSDYLWASFYAPPDTTAPPLTVPSPVDGTHVHNASVVVSGDTAAGVTRVAVNGIAAAVNEFGEFSVSVPLVPGDNTLWVQAWDPAGNEANAAVRVVYDDPSVALQAQLAATQAQLAAAQASLATTRADLVTAQGQIGALQTNQTATAAENTAQAAKITELQAGAGGSGTLLGVLGIVIGLAAMGMALMMSRKRPASPPPAPPPAKEEPKAAEPPK